MTAAPENQSAEAKVLVVEDDEQIRLFLNSFLTVSGFEVVSASSVPEAAALLGEADFQLALLDLMVGNQSGYDLLDLLKAKAVAVIMLTALSQQEDRIQGLDSGADDYISKPFDPRELLARMHAVLRRSGSSPSGSTVRNYHFNGWTLNLRTRKLFDPHGTRVFLRGSEVAVLQVFCEHPGMTLTREKILELCHTEDMPPTDRSVDLIVSRVRRRIEDNPRDPTMILTQRLAGYLFTPEVVKE